MSNKEESQNLSHEKDWETNRIKSKTAKKNSFWCYKCDGSHVGDFGKCDNCGYINNKKKIRNK